MTIEEQIQKSMSMADVVAVAAEPDELDDIDKVRDDLQSTKQMLALELRNKEALERENKRLMARLLNLEVELEKDKNSKTVETEKTGTVQQTRSETDEKVKKICSSLYYRNIYYPFSFYGKTNIQAIVLVGRTQIPVLVYLKSMLW